MLLSSIIKNSNVMMMMKMMMIHDLSSRKLKALRIIINLIYIHVYISAIVKRNCEMMQKI